MPGVIMTVFAPPEDSMSWGRVGESGGGWRMPYRGSGERVLVPWKRWKCRVLSTIRGRYRSWPCEAREMLSGAVFISSGMGQKEIIVCVEVMAGWDSASEVSRVAACSRCRVVRASLRRRIWWRRAFLEGGVGRSIEWRLAKSNPSVSRGYTEGWVCV